MAPSKWDDEEESSSEASSPRVYAPRRKFDDEEDSDDVLESWEAAEDSDVERQKAAKAAEAKAKAEAEAAAQKKKPKAQRIEELKELRRKQAEEEEDESSEEEEDLATQRARLKRSEKQSDLNHAEELFGEIDLNQKRSARKAAVVADSKDPTAAIDLSALPLFKPTTKAQFTTLTNTLIPLLTALSKKPQYAMWSQEFARQLVKELPSTEIRKTASALTTAANEKLKEEKAADKTGKKSKAAKTKASLVAARDNNARADLTAYDGGDGLDDDDFM